MSLIEIYPCDFFLNNNSPTHNIEMFSPATVEVHEQGVPQATRRNVSTCTLELPVPLCLLFEHRSGLRFKQITDHREAMAHIVVGSALLDTTTVQPARKNDFLFGISTGLVKN